MPTYKVSAGFRIDDVTINRIAIEGISPDIFEPIVRVLLIDRSPTDTLFTVDTDSEDTATNWLRALVDDLGWVEAFEIPAPEDPDPTPPTMDVWGNVGQWTKTAGVSTTTISSLPSQPKGVILWGSGLAGAAMGTYNEAGGIVIGFSDGTNNRCIGYAVQDNVSTSNSNRAIGQKAFYLVAPSGTSSSHILENGTVTFGATSFTITWSATTNATVGHYMVFGGDDIEKVLVGSFQMGTTSTGITTYTGVGEKYDLGLFLTPFVSGSWSTEMEGFTHAMQSVSIHAGDNSNRTWSSTIRHTDAVNPSNARRHQKRKVAFATMGTTLNNLQQYAKWIEWTEDGFVLDWLDAPNATTSLVGYMFVKGGKWDAGSFNQPTSAGTVRSILIDKDADIQAMMGISVNNVDIIGLSGISAAKYTVGAEDTDGNRGCLSYSSAPDGTSPTTEATLMVNDKFMKHVTADATASSSTLNAECTVSDIATNGEFTCNYTTADAVARQIVWFTLSA